MRLEFQHGTGDWGLGPSNQSCPFINGARKIATARELTGLNQSCGTSSKLNIFFAEDFCEISQVDVVLRTSFGVAGKQLQDEQMTRLGNRNNQSRRELERLGRGRDFRFDTG